MKNKKNWGGARKGTGPKPGNARLKTSITLQKDMLEWVKQQEGSISRVVERALLILKNKENR